MGFPNSGWSLRSSVAEGFMPEYCISLHALLARGSIVTACNTLQTETWSDQPVLEQYGHLDTVASLFFFVNIKQKWSYQSAKVEDWRAESLDERRKNTHSEVESDATQADSRSGQRVSAKSLPGRQRLRHEHEGDRWKDACGRRRNQEATENQEWHCWPSHCCRRQLSQLGTAEVLVMRRERMTEGIARSCPCWVSYQQPPVSFYLKAKGLSCVFQVFYLAFYLHSRNCSSTHSRVQSSP